jgi:hypothetical protein
MAAADAPDGAVFSHPPTPWVRTISTVRPTILFSLSGSPATGTSFVRFPFFLRNRERYPRHLVGPPILVLGLGLGGVGTPRSWSIDDQTAAANQVPFGSPGADQQGFYRLDIPDKVSDHIPHLTLSRSDTRCRPQRPSPPRSAHSTVCVFSSHSPNREYRRLQYRYT